MSEKRWMTEEEFLAFNFPPKTEVQVSTCQQTGQKFIALIVGRFRDRPERELENRKLRLLAFFSNCAITVDETVPLWKQVEVLENTLDFELNPPCGCEPEIKVKGATR